MNQVPAAQPVAAIQSVRFLHLQSSTRVRGSTRLTTVQDPHQERSQTAALQVAPAVHQTPIQALHRVHLRLILRPLQTAVAALTHTVEQVTRMARAPIPTRA